MKLNCQDDEMERIASRSYAVVPIKPNNDLRQAICRRMTMRDAGRMSERKRWGVTTRSMRQRGLLLWGFAALGTGGVSYCCPWYVPSTAVWCLLAAFCLLFSFASRNASSLGTWGVVVLPAKAEWWWSRMKSTLWKAGKAGE